MRVQRDAVLAKQAVLQNIQVAVDSDDATALARELEVCLRCHNATFEPNHISTLKQILLLLSCFFFTAAHYFCFHAPVISHQALHSLSPTHVQSKYQALIQTASGSRKLAVSRPCC